jgi:Rrf2 family iron-sulfur cluster assembly transcriptional regulator
VLLAIWDIAGEHMRQHLSDYTLESIAEAVLGRAPWPDLHHS